jgi:gliding motility-associated-like protein
MTIEISDEITPVFDPMGPYCRGASFTLPAVSANGIRGTWSPAINNTQTTTYTFTPGSGQCGVSATLTVEIADQVTPAFDPIGPFCHGASIAALPTISNNGIRGSWRPAINNTQTTTYTFTPDVGQCGTTTTLTVVILDEIRPTFTPVGPYCVGATIELLPTVSNNDIRGTWSPAINNQRTTTYTFTPDQGQCGTTASLTITISNELTPTFTQAGPYCAGSAIPALPTVSNNGIHGTWSPALNNAQTTVYTFTPDAGQCAVNTSMTITISDEVTPTFTQPATYCVGSVIAALPTISTNGIRGTWSPAIDNTRTTTYTFTPNAGQCGTTASLTIEISDPITPTFDPIGPFTRGSAIPALPTVSNNGIRGTWSPAINNQQTTTYTFRPNAGQCAVTTTLTIDITDLVVPTFDPVGPYCAGSVIPALPATSTNGITGSWSPAINNQQTTTYTFTPEAGQSAGVARLTININDVVRPTFTAVGPFCSGSSIEALPTTSNNDIHGTWSPAINNQQTTTYTFTPDDGQCATNASLTITISNEVTPTFAQVGPYCSGAVIAALPTTSTNGIRGTWSPAINNTRTTVYTFTPNAGQCASTATLTIIINPVTTPTFNAVGPFCPGSVITALPATSTNGIQGTWSPAINNTQTTTYTFTPTAGQCAEPVTLTLEISDAIVPTFNAVGPFCPGAVIADLPTTSNNGIRGRLRPSINNRQTTTYTFTPDAGQCGTTTTMVIAIEENAIPTFDPVGPYCAGSVIDALPVISNNGIRGAWSPAINNNRTTTYTFTPDQGQCGTTTTLTIAITNPTIPAFDHMGPYCAGSVITALPTVSNNGITGSWSPAINNQQTTTYTFTPDEGQCATTAALRIVIDQRTAPTFDQVASYCQGSAIAALHTVSNNGIRGSWRPAINNTRTTTYTFTPDQGQCGEPTTMTIEITNEVEPVFDPVGPYPRGSAIAALQTVSNNGIHGSWRPAIDNSQTTTYTFIPDAGQCSRPVRMTIAITDDIIPAFDPMGPFCTGSVIAELPAVSQNGIRGSWSPAINNRQTTTYTFTPNAGQGAAIVTMTITISDEILPTFNPAGPYCPGSMIANLPTVSNNDIRGTWSPAINNRQTTTYTFTPNPGQCALPTTQTIEIGVDIVPDFDLVGPFCPGTNIESLPVVSKNGIRGRWSPVMNNMVTTNYLFTPLEGQCAVETSLTCEIGSEITPTFVQAGPYCEGSVIAALPTTSTNGVPGTWSPAIDNTQTTTYTFTPRPGRCALPTTMTITIDPGVTPTFTPVASYCPGAVIPALPLVSNNGIRGTWSPAINNQQTTTYTFTPEAGQCASQASMVITIDPEVTPTFTPVASYCPGAVIPALPLVSNNGIRGTWSPAINNQLTTTYTFTPNSDQCASPATLTIEIMESIVPEFAQRDLYCTGAAIAGLPNTSLNNIRGTWSPAINNQQTTTYTFTPDAGQCATTAKLTILINPEPAMPVARIIDPDCNISTGTLEVVSPRGSQYQYRLDGAIYQDAALFSGLAPNSTHTLQVKDVQTGCESKITTVIVHSLPQPPAVPMVLLVINPKCDGGGVIQITSPTGDDFEYRMDGHAYQSTATFTNVTRGEHLIWVRNKMNECESAAATFIIPEVAQDMDFDGIADDVDLDVDGDGILNSFEGGLTADTDGDGHLNYMDIDADGDGIVDNMEAQNTTGYILPSNSDKDQDGLDDAYDKDQEGTELIPVDSDKDGAPDFMDLDADNDLVPDFIEGHDENSNGKPDHYALNADADKDGLDNGYDNIPNVCGALDNALGSNAPTQDFDQDGMPDWRDENDDDDQYLTRYEDLNADGDFSNDDIDFDGYPEYLDYGRDCDLFIPDAFSPNGDNVHDLFMIYCINHYPDASIYIFDQLGNRIYEKKHYGNMEFWKIPEAAWWNGKPTSGPGYSKNDKVPPGTYYYVLDLGNGEVKKSYVFVSY